MPVENEQQLREEADQFYLRGLRVSAQSADDIDLEIGDVLQFDIEEALPPALTR